MGHTTSCLIHRHEYSSERDILYYSGQSQGIEVYLGSSHLTSSYLKPKSENLDLLSLIHNLNHNLKTWHPASVSVHPPTYQIIEVILPHQ